MAKAGCKRKLSNILRDELDATPAEDKAERMRLIEAIWKSQELEIKIANGPHRKRRKSKKEKEEDSGEMVINPGARAAVIAKAIQIEK